MANNVTMDETPNLNRLFVRFEWLGHTLHCTAHVSSWGEEKRRGRLEGGTRPHKEAIIGWNLSSQETLSR